MVARVRFAPPHTRSDRRLLPFSTSRMDRTPCSRTGRLASKASTRLRLPLRCASRVVLIRKESLTARSLPFRVNSTLILSSQLMDSDPARFILLALSLLSLETRLVPSGSLETVLDATLDLHLLFQMELLDLLPLLSQLPYHQFPATTALFVMETTRCAQMYSCFSIVPTVKLPSSKTGPLVFKATTHVEPSCFLTLMVRQDSLIMSKTVRSLLLKVHLTPILRFILLAGMVDHVRSILLVPNHWLPEIKLVPSLSLEVAKGVIALSMPLSVDLDQLLLDPLRTFRIARFAAKQTRTGQSLFLWCTSLLGKPPCTKEKRPLAIKISTQIQLP